MSNNPFRGAMKTFEFNAREGLGTALSRFLGAIFVRVGILLDKFFCGLLLPALGLLGDDYLARQTHGPITLVLTFIPNIVGRLVGAPIQWVLNLPANLGKILDAPLGSQATYHSSPLPFHCPKAKMMKGRWSRIIGLVPQVLGVLVGDMLALPVIAVDAIFNVVEDGCGAIAKLPSKVSKSGKHIDAGTSHVTGEKGAQGKAPGHKKDQPDFRPVHTSGGNPEGGDLASQGGNSNRRDSNSNFNNQ